MKVIVSEVDADPDFKASTGTHVCALMMIDTLGVALAAMRTVGALVNVVTHEHVTVRPHGTNRAAVAFFHVE